ncbi:hypothetical protein PHYSODRAFT_327780 [Phytophthora sojae]|uniref:Uncharacterized protein n=1 Tax=Phytophthora sojae (strain P6497) TaxID=1094619 RepID=G4Z6J0_PHYSP|nr:hypothetical protein PHYSODRAFT_327780 [Phytophthora sojae]EGZ19560.1 hypothetical protein PHYSODRAFT_327780 [Phytophthora sojae]|eukprot:XP_009522277.1 hypothetical protein PHYSODRAFT_327780 [Phytophthora sojae]
MGSKLRSPNELLRRTSVAEAGELTKYHERLLAALASSQRYAEQAREREQLRQARYYNRRVKQRRTFEAGDRVWMYRPPRGPKASKFVHQWIGPMKIIEPAGYDNYLIEREDKSGECEQFVAHVSFLVTYRYPAELLRDVAADLEAQLEHEGAFQREGDAATAGETVGATSAPARAATAGHGKKRDGRAVASASESRLQDELLVELRRRRRRNRAGTTYLSTSCSPYAHVDDSVEQRRMTNGVGCPYASTIDCIRPAESWKTLQVEKTCNRTWADGGHGMVTTEASSGSWSHESGDEWGMADESGWHGCVVAGREIQTTVGAESRTNAILAANGRSESSGSRNGRLGVADEEVLEAEGSAVRAGLRAGEERAVANE